MCGSPITNWYVLLFKSLFFTHWGCSVICVPMWVKVEGSAEFFWLVHLGKVNHQAKEGNTALGEKKNSHGIKKKKKLKHSFGGSWSPGCSPLGAVLSTMSPIQESPVPLQQMQIMH